jgi:hypothetical protein
MYFFLHFSSLTTFRNASVSCQHLIDKINQEQLFGSEKDPLTRKRLAKNISLLSRLNS